MKWFSNAPSSVTDDSACVQNETTEAILILTKLDKNPEAFFLLFILFI